jgi:glycerophosphoryl diester phosphodiesterase
MKQTGNLDTRVVLLHALLFLAFWLTNLPYQATLNNFLIGMTGLKADFLLFFMLFAGLAALWSAARLFLGRGGPVWLFRAVGVFFVVFFYASFAVLFIKNPVQLARLGQLFEYFRLFVDAGLLFFLAWTLGGRARAGGKLKKNVLAGGLLLLWLLPLFLPPGNVYRGALPQKPRLFAHRGASTLAPENTLAAMRAAADLGIYGLETDINVSADGELFLLHDATPARTTDAARVFPGREVEPAENFSWAELSRLDAGGWFGGGAGFAGEPLPSLETVLQLVVEDDLLFLYDLRVPAAGHAYHDQALAMCLDAIRAAGAAGQTWVLAEPEGVARVRSILPEAILAFGIGYTDVTPAPKVLTAAGYRVVNSAYGLPLERIHAYQAAGLWVNLWVVDEPWQFSRLWLAGANSVASNRVQNFLAMPRPRLALPYGSYLALWGLLGAVAGGVFWRRARAAAPEMEPERRFVR